MTKTQSSRSLKSLIYISLFSFTILLVCTLYYKGLNGPFLLDDLQSIEPAQITDFSLSHFLEISMQNSSGPLGRPLAIASFALTNYFFGLNPYAYKSVNLALHILIGFAAFLVIFQIASFSKQSKPYAMHIAFLTSILWLIHPLHVSTVLYAVQRMTQLADFFILIGLMTYLWGRIRLNSQQSYAILIMAISYLVFFPLALLSKETGVLFPVYALCIEYFILKFECPLPMQELFLKRFNSILNLSLLLGALVYYWFELPKFLNMFAEKNITIVDRLLTQIKALGLYLKLTLMPKISQMGLYHDDFPVSTHIDQDVVINLIILLSCLLIIIVSRRKAPVVAFGLTWFFVSQIVESTVIPLEQVFEHRNYLGSLGLLFVPVNYFVLYIEKFGKTFRRICFFLLFLLFVLLLGMTYARSYIWSDNTTFLKYEALFHPFSPRVHIELANYHVEHKDYNGALAELEIAQILQPYNAGIALHKILIFCNSQTVPDGLYKEAFAKIRQGAITPYVIMVLDGLVTNIFNHQCSTVDKTKVLELINACLKNPFLTYRPLYKAVLYHLEAGIELNMKNPAKSRDLLLKSFHAYPKRLSPLIQKAYLELQDNQVDEAQNTINQVHEHAHFYGTPHHEISKLDKAFKVIKDNQQKYGQ